MIVDCVNLILVEPFNSLTIFPQTKFDLAILGDEVSAQAMLLALVPVPLIAAPVCPGVNSETMLLIILVLTLVHPAIVPDVNAHALHVVVKPLALIFSAIEP